MALTIMEINHRNQVCFATFLQESCLIFKIERSSDLLTPKIIPQNNI